MHVCVPHLPSWVLPCSVRVHGYIGTHPLAAGEPCAGGAGEGLAG